MRTSPGADALGDVLASEHARIMGAVIARLGEWQLAEDALQDAVTRALETWDVTGIPSNPAGWLVTTARRRGIDLFRRADTRDAMHQRLGVAVERGLLDGEPEPEIGDDRLRLLCTCAHPALSLESRVVLTLRTVLGVPPERIAALFLVSEAAVRKRLTRARAKIADAGIPYRVPGRAELPARLDGVLAVVYLLFTLGYAGADEPDEQDGPHVPNGWGESRGPDGPVRPAASGALDAAPLDAMTEAIRLVRMLIDLLEPDDAIDAEGLLALMLLHRSRSLARSEPDGTPIPMHEQDRARWDRAAIDEARARLGAATARAAHARLPVGRYTLQAAIALEHALAEDESAMDWPKVARLHALLARVAPSPSQAVARAVAAGRAHSPAEGLRLLGTASAEFPALDVTPTFHAARGELLERAGRDGEARAAFRRAAGLATSEPQRRALERRAEQSGFDAPRG